MKSVVTPILIAAFLLLLAITNPDMNAFEQYLKARILASANQHGQLGGAIGSLVAGLGGKIEASATTRTNYLLFSTFETRLATSTRTTIGVAGQFFVLAPPDTAK
jgi:hypothetical protein